MNELSDFDFLNLIEKSRASAQREIQQKKYLSPEKLLYNEIRSNLFYLNNHNAPYYCQIGNLENKTSNFQEESFFDKHSKGIVGAGMVALGSPIIKKRFVTKGTVSGTSIASSFFSRAFPQNLPFRVYTINAKFKLVATKTMGRAIGRLIPNIGMVLLIIDAVDILVEVYQSSNKKNTSPFFGGGIGSGGGAYSGW